MLFHQNQHYFSSNPGLFLLLISVPVNKQMMKKKKKKLDPNQNSGVVNLNHIVTLFSGVIPFSYIRHPSPHTTPSTR